MNGRIELGWMTSKWNHAGTGHYFSVVTESSCTAMSTCGRGEMKGNLQGIEDVVHKCKRCLKIRKEEDVI